MQPSNASLFSTPLTQKMQRMRLLSQLGSSGKSKKHSANLFGSSPAITDRNAAGFQSSLDPIEAEDDDEEADSDSDEEEESMPFGGDPEFLR